MFSPNTADLDYLFDSSSQTVTINDTERKAIITNPAISEFDQKYIHTIEQVLQGDMIALEGERYLVITESISKRGGKYKALMRHCNIVIERQGEEVCVIVGENEFGDPIQECTVGDPIFISAIVDNKSFSIDDSSAIRVPDNQIIVVVQDNQVNRDKLKVNDTFNFEGNYKVLNRDFTKKGLMILTCEKSA